MRTTVAEPVHVAAGVICRDSHILIAKRPDHLHKGGFWEFPGGKIQAGEQAEEALSRELKEELGIEIDSHRIEYLMQIDWEYSEKIVQLEVFLVRKFSQEPKGMEGQKIRWVKSADIENYMFPEANAEIVSWVKSNF